jgi:hypothetical protein
VVAPSETSDGAYLWSDGLGLNGPIQSLPEPTLWLSAELDRSTKSIAQHITDANTIPSGQRNATLTRLAGTMRRMGMSQAEIADALHTANPSRCDLPLSSSEVDRIAASVARYEPDAVSVALVEDHYSQMTQDQKADEDVTEPGPAGE